MHKPIEHIAFQAGPLKGRRFHVPETGLQIGRDSKNDLPVSDDTLSRAHSRFFFRGGRLWISDLKSANGTEVNGVRIENHPLEAGDHVVLGVLRARVLHNGVEGIPGFWERRRRARQGPPPTTAAAFVPGRSPPPRVTQPAKPLWRGIADVLLLAWWLLLAYSLWLPPPETQPDDPEVTIDEVSTGSDTGSSADQAGAAQPGAAPASDSPMHALRTSIARLLLAENYHQATALLASHGSDALTPGDQADLAALEKYVATVQALNARIAGAIGAQAGRRILLRSARSSVAFHVIAAAGTKIQGELVTTNGEKKVTLDVSKLHPEDRLLWLGEPATPEENALCCALAHRGGTRDAVARYAGAAGMLAAAYAEVLATPEAAAAGETP